MNILRFIIILVALVYCAYAWNIAWLTSPRLHGRAESSRRRILRMLRFTSGIRPIRPISPIKPSPTHPQRS